MEVNETRNIIVGLEIGKQQSQICYFDRKEKEPISISVKTGSNQYLFPTMLSKKPGEEVWHFGMEAQYFSRNEGEIPVTGLLAMESQKKFWWMEPVENQKSFWNIIFAAVFPFWELQIR